MQVYTVALIGKTESIGKTAVVRIIQPDHVGRFDDDEAYSYEPYHELLSTLTITKGCGSTGVGYCPGRSATRGQMAGFLVRTLGLEPVPRPDPNDPTVVQTFTDVPTDHFWWPEIERLAIDKITFGCGDGTRYCVNDATQRSQMAAFLVRSYKDAAVEESLCASTDLTYVDINCQHWAWGYIERLAERITPISGDYYHPDWALSRSRVANWLVQSALTIRAA